SISLEASRGAPCVGRNTPLDGCRYNLVRSNLGHRPGAIGDGNAVTAAGFSARQRTSTLS
ncbi:MAG: hypothetical protein ACJ8BC_14695, partial [Gemmatimonadales bacterium]